jgi:hypothetical protein
MGFGRYRFRRSFGNVASQFRGARPSTYPLFSGLLDQYPNAAAAYSLRALSSGWLAGDVVEVRRSSDSTTDTFTAGQITGGQMLSFVNNNTTSLYNSARYFNGTSTSVETTGMTSSISYFGACTISADIVVDSTSLTGVVFSLGSASYRLLKTSGGWNIGTNTATGVSVAAGPQTVSVTFDSSGNGISFSIDGTEVWTGTAPGSLPGTSFTLGSRAGGLFFKGSIRNFAITGSSVKNFAYTGLGTSVTAWEDTIGSNDGTETNGAAYTGQPFDGFVSTWYDQSGNANDATQATTTAQPKIVSAGSLVTGGLDFDGVNDFFETSLVPPNAATLIGVANWDVEDQTRMIIGARDGLTQRSYLSQASSGQSAIGVSSSALTDGHIVAGDDYLLFGAYSGSTRLLSTNGSVISDSLGSAPNNTIQGYSVGAFNTAGTNASFMDGTLAEVIVYNSDQSSNRVGIETNINAAYTIY